MTNEIKMPESKGKFRKDVFERSLQAIKTHKPAKSPYRAVGDNAKESSWGRDKEMESLKGLLNSNR